MKHEKSLFAIAIIVGFMLTALAIFARPTDFDRCISYGKEFALQSSNAKDEKQSFLYAVAMCTQK